MAHISCDILCDTQTKGVIIRGKAYSLVLRPTEMESNEEHRDFKAHGSGRLGDSIPGTRKNRY